MTRSAFRYGVVSGICLILGMVLIPSFDMIGLHYVFATVVAFAIVAVVGFLLHCCWTFDADRSWISFIRYVSAMAINIPLTVILIAIGHDLLAFSVAQSTVMALTLLSVWNFVAVRWAMLGRVSGDVG